MRKKTADELLKSGNRAAAKKRRAQESSSVYGLPARPPCLPRASRNAWNSIVEEYRDRLHKSDTELVMQLVNAKAEQYRGAGERKESARGTVKQIEAQLSSRKPVEVPKQKVSQEQQQESEQNLPDVSLQDFLAATQQCRDTFSERLIAGQTMMLVPEDYYANRS